jgi:two-component system chemotaxis response regulator CheY
MKVLVVDDSVTMRKMIKRILAGMGITDVVEAGDGREALEILNIMEGIDLVLLDWNMPEMTGLEFTEAVRNDGRFDGIPIIMISSNTSKSEIIRAIGAGVDNYIAKPFTPEVLKRKIEQTLAKYGATGGYTTGERTAESQYVQAIS